VCALRLKQFLIKLLNVPSASQYGFLGYYNHRKFVSYLYYLSDQGVNTFKILAEGF